MNSLVVRQLLVDWQQPIPRHWYGGDAFGTAFFNALSMSVPVAEQFVMDSVRGGLEALSAADRERFSAEVQSFIAQEAIHRRMHSLFNEKLEGRGLINTWGPRLLRRHEKMLSDSDVLPRLAVAAAYEHFTGIIASWQLRNPQTIGEQDTRAKALWLWHASEECEHKTTIFDLYQAVGGNQVMRIAWFHRLTFFLIVDMTRQTLRNLHRDQTLWRWSTWTRAVRLLFRSGGLMREAVPGWFAYKRSDFHPNQIESKEAAAWLVSNGDKFRLIKK